MTGSQVETEATEAAATPATSRRAMLAGAGAVGASALLAACGTDDGGSLADGDGGATTAPTTSAPTSKAPAGNGNDAADKLADTADIPENGGKIFKDKGVVVTQPASGTFKGFTATCTHAGCTVANVKNGTINCGCHGSQFSVEDGSVQKGPATQGLDEVSIKVDGDSITLA